LIERLDFFNRKYPKAFIGEPEMTQRGQKRLRTLPAIRRARGFYLYDNSGKRILDLYLDGGRAWLGHRPEGLSLQIKNTLSRGVYSPYPGSEEGKLLKAAEALAVQAGCREGCRALYVRSWESAKSIPRAMDSLFTKQGECMLWRPGLPWPQEAELVEILVPLPGFESGRVLITKKTETPSGDLPSPVIAAALSRSLWTLKSRLETPLAAADIETGESWIKKGPYYLYKGEEEAFDELFKEALAAGILLPPEMNMPMIIPCEFSPGDQNLLSSFFRKVLKP